MLLQQTLEGQSSGEALITSGPFSKRQVQRVLRKKLGVKVITAAAAVECLDARDK